MSDGNRPRITGMSPTIDHQHAMDAIIPIGVQRLREMQQLIECGVVTGPPPRYLITRVVDGQPYGYMINDHRRVIDHGSVTGHRPPTTYQEPPMFKSTAHLSRNPVANELHCVPYRLSLIPDDRPIPMIQRVRLVIVGLLDRWLGGQR